MEIRNIAIIAHVDHGKTTLTDALLKQCGVVEEGVSMDSNQIEKERGITIYSKNTSLVYKGTKINIVDTPGHADFGGEVERVLRAIDTVLLIVDAQEGPMPQTRFVLRKSLELGLKPILVINKIDKPAANPQKAHDDVYILMMELGATDEQLDFTTVYAIGREGVAMKNLSDERKNLDPLLDVVLEKVPVSSTRTDGDFQAQVFNLGYDNFLGRLGVTRVYQGTMKITDNVIVKTATGELKGKATKLFTFNGINRVEVEEVTAGDIVLIAGFPDISIGDTFVVNPETAALPTISIDEPTISVRLLVNDSPLSGRDGKFVTTRQIKERLEKELQIKVGL
jgi:GTP-binding protein